MVRAGGKTAGRGSWDRPLGADVLRLEARPLGGDVLLLVARLAHLHAGLRGLRALREGVALLPLGLTNLAVGDLKI